MPSGVFPEAWKPDWGERTLLMAVVNATPDSFSGDGLDRDLRAIHSRVTAAVSEGADVFDVGGQSTRPGHTVVPLEEELARVIPAVNVAVRCSSLPVSVDTARAVVARAALEAGAAIVNDVSGLNDPRMTEVVAQAGAWLILVHRGRPGPGQDLIDFIRHGLAASRQRAEAAGVDPDRMIVDPGLGIGKGWRENFEILRRLAELRDLGLPLLLGPSRKGMIGKVLGVGVDDRVEGTAALVSVAVAQGASMVRVHDVAAMQRVVTMMDSIVRDGPEAGE